MGDEMFNFDTGEHDNISLEDIVASDETALRYIPKLYGADGGVMRMKFRVLRKMGLSVEEAFLKTYEQLPGEPVLTDEG